MLEVGVGDYFSPALEAKEKVASCAFDGSHSNVITSLFFRNSSVASCCSEGHC